MRFFLLIYLLCAGLSAFSQDTLQSGSFLQVDWENDAFQIRQRNITDRYYSNGIRLSHLSNYWRKWPTRHTLLRLRPKDNQVYPFLYSFTAGQEIYTPRNVKIARRPLYPNDRPYAGYLYASWGLTTTDPVGARRLSSSLTLGMIGPVSGAADVQEWLHGVLGQYVPVGWGAQMKNDPMISYAVQYEGRAIPRFSSAFDVIGHVEGTIGTLMNSAGMGGTLRIGLFNDYFQNPTGFYRAGGTAERRFQCYAFVRVGFRTVLDNALLQGGWVNGAKNYYALPAVELQHFYGQTDVGGVIATRQAQLTFTQHLRTAEFRGALPDQWGHISLLVRVGRGSQY
ncbi:lipid A deacylase LpxR family protein [Spirosoma rigui]|uniref:lipid A deacylase LpxR family protein n=1 Tax=Spirosoma rigui TaxID=564064 RepID=UPI0009AF34CA|nr:lipid A deacylase LpxR family protein [Spirosoma rigui]